MMRALYSGVSGMRSHQTEMDVIGNNIANVNTYAYKSQRTTFRDVYYQSLGSPSKPESGTVGGTNSSQVGYGAQIGSVDTIHTMSGYSPTNKDTDLYINGDGYFTVQNASGDIFYTRNGSVEFDSAGNLVDSNGSLVLGKIYETGDTPPEDTDTEWAGDLEPITIANLHSDYKNVTINSDGSITAYLKSGTDDTIKTLGYISVSTFPNESALILEGNSYYSKSINSGEPENHLPGLYGTGALVTGGLEMSNVDLANEFANMIVTQRGFQANTKIISVVDQMLEELVNLKR